MLPAPITDRILVSEKEDLFQLILLGPPGPATERLAETLRLWFRGTMRLSVKESESARCAAVTLHSSPWDFAVVLVDFPGGEPEGDIDEVLETARRMDIPTIVVRPGDADAYRAHAHRSGALDCCDLDTRAYRPDDRLRNLLGAFLRRSRLEGARPRGKKPSADTAMFGMMADLRGRWEEERTRTQHLETEKRRIRDAFGLYVHDTVIEGILSREIPLEQRGRQRLVSVMFADIRGFTTIAESMNPLHVISFLNEFFTAMTEVIEDHSGMIDKYIGDSIMSLFGVLSDDQPHADQATRAARMMQEVFLQWLPGWIRNYGFKPALGIGIATGPVILGNIGSFQKLSYTAIGDTVNLAARLENTAKPGEIILAESTVRGLAHTLRESLPAEESSIAVRGKQQECRIYRLRAVAQEGP